MARGSSARCSSPPSPARQAVTDMQPLRALAGAVLGAIVVSAAPGAQAQPSAANPHGARAAYVSRAAATSFAISLAAGRSATPLDGRIILLVSADLTREPRSHVSPDGPLDSPYLFGVNVDAFSAAAAVIIDDHAFGWPAAKLSQLAAGNYLVQAVLNRYETFHLSDGRVLKLPPDQGEGQQWARKPGNLYSTPLKVHLDAAHPAKIALILDQTIPPIAAKADSEFIRHIRVRSELLSHFWGRDVFLGAHILV